VYSITLNRARQAQLFFLPLIKLLLQWLYLVAEYTS
jgi:hypothetical protein